LLDSHVWKTYNGLESDSIELRFKEQLEKLWKNADLISAWLDCFSLGDLQRNLDYTSLPPARNIGDMPVHSEDALSVIPEKKRSFCVIVILALNLFSATKSVPQFDMFVYFNSYTYRNQAIYFVDVKSKW